MTQTWWESLWLDQILTTDARGGTSWSSADNRQEGQIEAYAMGPDWGKETRYQLFNMPKMSWERTNTHAKYIIFKSSTGFNGGKCPTPLGYVMKCSTKIITVHLHSALNRFYFQLKQIRRFALTNLEGQCHTITNPIWADTNTTLKKSALNVLWNSKWSIWL